MQRIVGPSNVQTVGLKIDSFFSDDDEDVSTPMEVDDDEDGEGKGERKDKEVKEEKKEEGEKETETPMEQQAEEDDVDPLDAYMEEVKQEVKKFNMGGVKGNDKVSVRAFCIVFFAQTSPVPLISSTLSTRSGLNQLLVFGRREQ